MADENIELQRQMAELSSQMQGLGTATSSAAQDVKSFGDAAISGAKASISSLNSLAGAMGQGQTNFKALNGAIDASTAAIGSMASVIPYFGGAIDGFVKSIGLAGKYMMGQLDDLTGAFNQMSQVGALTATGMEGLTDQFLKSGLNLQQFVKQVNENSQALARFRGMTAKGADEFAAITGKLTDRTEGADDSLRRLGMSSEDISSTAAAFVTQQTRLGRAQAMTTDQIIDGTKKYAFELDALSKVTGLNRQAIQKQQDAALSEARFRANIDELEARGEAGQKAANALLNFQTQLSAFPDLAQGMRDLTSGAANTAASQKLMASTGGAAQQIINNLKNGTIDQYEAMIQLQGAVRGMIVPMRDNAKYTDAANSAFSNFAQLSDFEKAQYVKNGEEIRRIQKEQTTIPERKPGQVFDDLTTQVVSAQKAMEQMGIEVTKLSYTFLPGAAAAARAMVTAMKEFTQYVNSTLSPSEAEIQQRYDRGRQSADPSYIPQGPEEGRLNRQQQEQLRRGNPNTGTNPLFRSQSAAPSSGSDPYAGLRIKSGESTAGGNVNEKLPEIARLIQQQLGNDLKYFSAFNDRYHMDTYSAHAQGNAMDFTLADPSKSAAIAAQIKSIPGITQVMDEYTSPSRGSTGGHIHAEISARNGAVLSGPASGYQPNLAMHGTEAIVPLNPAVAQNLLGTNKDSDLMREQIDKMDEMISVLKNQLTVSTRLMQYSA
jgi:hypothetical protein